MDGMTVLWIVLAVVVVLILVAVIMAGTRKSRERRLEELTAHLKLRPIRRRTTSGMVRSSKAPSGDEPRG
jgi:ABC-type lipoprotein release transport system permease subunit